MADPSARHAFLTLPSLGVSWHNPRRTSSSARGCLPRRFGSSTSWFLIPIPERSGAVRAAAQFLLHVHGRSVELAVDRVRDYLGRRKASSDPRAIAQDLDLDERVVREALRVLAKERETARRDVHFWEVAR